MDISDISSWPFLIIKSVLLTLKGISAADGLLSGDKVLLAVVLTLVALSALLYIDGVPLLIGYL